MLSVQFFSDGFGLDHVEIQALCATLQLNVDVAYLNGGSEGGVVDFIPFRYASGSESLPLVLLYR